jgi:hypothetical protein
MLLSNSCQKGRTKRQAGLMQGRQDGSMAGWKCGRMAQDGRMEGWEDGRMAGWQDNRMAGWQDGRITGWQDQDGRMAGMAQWQEWRRQTVHILQRDSAGKYSLPSGNYVMPIQTYFPNNLARQ